MSQFIYTPLTSNPSKTTLSLLISLPPLQLLGLDRIYMGCMKSGFLKFLLFVGATVGMFFAGPFWLPIVLLMLLWNFFDWIVAMINILSFSTRRVYCNTNMGWSSERDIRIAFWLGIALNLINIAFLLYIISLFINEGVEWIVDQIRGKTKMEKFMPTGKEVKEFLQAV